MKYLSLTLTASALLLAPATAHAQFFGGFDNSTVLGGLTGAGIGGAIGSNLAGSGNRDEGTAIGAALGGLAGAAYGNSRSNYYGNPYAGSFNPGFSGNSLLGTTIGAGIGGAIGSNLAGSGVRQEGTAIGAVLGGLAGNALSSRSRYGNSGFGNAGFGGEFAQPGFGGNTRYGASAPVIGGGFGGGFIPPSYGPGFGAPLLPPPPLPVPQFGATLPPMPMGGTSFVPGGFVNAGTFASTTTILPPANPMPIPAILPAPAPAPVYQPLSTAFTGVTVAAPNVRLAGPSLRSTSTRYGDSIGSTVTQDYVSSTGINAPLVLRPAPKPQTIIIERDTYTAPTTTVSMPSYTPSYVSSPARSMPSITADTVNINYGNNSQVGTTNSNNGSTVNAGHSHAGYSQPTTFNAPSGPIDFGDGIGNGTFGDLGRGSSVNTGSYSVGSTSMLGGYSNKMPAYSSSSRYSSGTSIAPQTTPSNGAGGSYLVTSGQGFQAPSPAEYNATCAASSAGCGAAAAPAYNWNAGSSSTYTAPAKSYNHSSYKSHSGSGSYSFCGSSKVYNDDGALLVGGSPVCR